MKSNTIFRIIILISLFFFLPQQSDAQFFKKLGDKAKAKIEGEADKRSEKMVNDKIDEGYDKAEDQIEGNGKSNDKKSENKEEKTTQQPTSTNQTTKDNKVPDKPKVVWSKFDFVPGDTIIFADQPSMDEENGEFPSRWDLYKGNAEIGEVDGENVIMFLQGGYIIPYLKNAKEDYLPEIFTIEFDVYFKEDSPGRYWLHFSDNKNQRVIYPPLEIYVNGLEIENSNKRYPGTDGLNWNENKEGKWRHISVAYTKGKFKAYMDDTRLINIPHFEDLPTGITLQAENNSVNEKYLKNIRIAKGGVKYYDRVLTDGKIIVNGIKFDINKANLKPESMGPINKIYQLMLKKPEINFSVEGHTDSDGNEEDNLKLSKERGKTVMNKLIEMGINKSRLKFDGFGEAKPIDNNSSPEGKANNRRVEFVKF